MAQTAGFRKSSLRQKQWEPASSLGLEGFRSSTSYNEQHEASENYASHKSDAAFLTRIAVNFIRHELTEYDYALADVAGKIGITKAVDGIRQKVYSAIARAYPGFATECERQCAARQDQA